MGNKKNPSCKKLYELKCENRRKIHELLVTYINELTPDELIHKFNEIEDRISWQEHLSRMSYAVYIDPNFNPEEAMLTLEDYKRNQKTI